MPYNHFDTTNPFKSLKSTLCQSSRDWTENKYDMWIYGIVFGYDDDSFEELKQKYYWLDDYEISRLKILHSNFENYSNKGR